MMINIQHHTYTHDFCKNREVTRLKNVHSSIGFSTEGVCYYVSTARVLASSITVV